jgi:hypothetical protein
VSPGDDDDRQAPVKRLIAIAATGAASLLAVSADARSGHHSAADHGEQRAAYRSDTRVAAKRFTTRATAHFDAGGVLRVRATRLSPKRVRVTAILVAGVRSPTRYTLDLGICTRGGCIDAGGKAYPAGPVMRGTTHVGHTAILERHGPGVIACVTASPRDAGPDPAAAGRAIGLKPTTGVTSNGAQLCPAMR